MNNLRITVLSPNRKHLDDIEQALQGLVNGHHFTAIRGSLRQLGTVAKQLAADVLVVDSSEDEAGDLMSLEQVSVLHPRTAVILLCKEQSPELLIQAMRLGVREVLALPVDALSLESAIARIVSKTGFAEAKNAKVLAFVSCKGGSGATFLASNLAYALSLYGDAKVALFDLNLQFGDAHLFLSDDKTEHTLSDVIRGIHRLDLALLKASMVHVGANLGVLAAPEDPSHSLEAKPEHIDALLSMARRYYDYIILDVGRTVDATTVRALDQADLIYAVMQANLPFVRGAKRMADVFRKLEYPANKIEFIINRYEKSGDLGLKDIEAALGERIARVVPNHYEAVAASVNQGMPITKLARSSPVSKSLMEWSEHLQGKPAEDSKNWITRVLKRA